MNYFLEAIAAAFHMIFSLDPEVYSAVWTSLKVSLTASLLAALAGIPVGMAIALRRFPGRGLVLLGLNTLMALPTVVVGLLVYALLTRRGLLGQTGLLYDPGGIVIGEFILAFPIVANLSVSAINGLDPRLLLTCKSLGASTLRQGWIILREGRPAVMAAVVAAFGRVIGEVGIAMMIGGNIRGHTRTMTTAIALQASMGQFELGLALGFLLLSVALMVNALLHRLQS